MNPVKLGVIGCGIAANERHWPALKELKDKFEITAVCNNTGQKAKEFAEKIGGAPYFLDYHDLLQRPDVEAVDIALPINLNFQVTKDALAAGKHVIVEKPMAVNLDEAKSMLDLEPEYPNLVKMVAENFYYHTVYHRLKEFLDEGRIGQPYAIFWDLFRVLDSTNRYVQTGWRIDHKYPGGFITDGGIHNIAALRLMFGDIISGCAFTKSINPAIGKTDTFSFQFETSNGVHGVLNIFLSSNGYDKNQILILGSQGSIVVKNNQRIVIKKNGNIEHEEILEKDVSYVEEFRDFYEAMRTGKKVKSSFAEGYRDLQILLGALESAEKSHIKL